MKKLLAILLCLAMVFAFAACGNDPAPADNPAPADTDTSDVAAGTYTMVIGHVCTTDSMEQQQLEKFKELVEAKTNGALEVTIYPNEQLGQEKEICEAVAMGTCDMGFSEGSVWSTVVDKRELNVLALPFLYNGVEAMNDTAREIVRNEYQELCEGTPILAIGSVCAGTRQMFSVDKPITCLEDMKGMKMRVPAASIYVEMMEALGANPTTTAYSECYQALQQGVVDGCELDIPNSCIAHWIEVCHYMTYTNHLAALNELCINRDKWDSYPAEIQDAIYEAMAEAEEYSFGLRADADAKYLEELRAAGVEEITLSQEELQKFKDALVPMYQEYRDLGLDYIFDAIAEINARYE